MDNKQAMWVWFRTLKAYSLAFFILILFGVSNAMMAPTIIQDMGFKAQDMGLISSSYFICLCIGIIPSGIMLDHLGPKKTQAIYFVIMSIGIAIFGIAHSKFLFIIGRLLLGFSGGISALGGMLALRNHVQHKYWTWSIGLILASGGVGGIMAGYPIEELVLNFGWRSTCLVLSALGFIALIIFLLLAPKDEVQREKFKLGVSFSKISEVFRSRLFWGMTLFTAVAYGTFVSYQTLWIAPWLIHVMDKNIESVSFFIMMMNLGMTIGVILNHPFYVLAKKLKVSYGHFINFVSFLSVVVLFLLSSKHLSNSWIEWGLYALLAQVSVHAYTLFTKKVSRELFPLFIAMHALCLFFVTFVVQSLTGIILDSWPSSYIHHYPYIAFKWTFYFAIFINIVAFIFANIVMKKLPKELHITGNSLE
ncbi:MAG: MFS transporter [Rhabdochlamydiaceae bacterium]|nr:MFS transporter [Candidatus Amphrikana amoebophyrae]